jgi:ribonucleotide monophosphatase NagD (HAD superfamily)
MRVEAVLFDRYLELVLASTDVNTGKPQAAIFEHALRRLALEPSQAWHVGDGLHTDVAGALNAGLTAVWLNCHGAQREDHHPTTRSGRWTSCWDCFECAWRHAFAHVSMRPCPKPSRSATLTMTCMRRSFAGQRRPASPFQNS